MPGKLSLVLALLLLIPAPLQAGEEEEDILQVTPTGRAFVLWSMESGEEPNEFSIASARLGMSWSAGPRIRGEIEIEASEMLGGMAGSSLLRDAYLEVKPLCFLWIKAGQFKRSFSRIELTSKKKLETISRGIGNSWFVGRLGHGDRDLGVQLSGDLPGRVTLTLGIFNGSGKNSPETDLDGSKDGVARVTWRMFKPLTLGASFSLKTFDPDADTSLVEQAWAGGLDLRFKKKGLQIVLEGLAGDAHLSGGDPVSWSALLLASWRFRLPGGHGLQLQPVVRAEYLEPDNSIDQDGVMAAAAGVNLLIGPRLRLMVDGQWQEPQAASGYNSEKSLLVQLAFGL